jgi:DNA-binding NarL/FixJ family response regulator
LLLEPELARTAAGPERAALLVALARVRSYDDDVRGASELYRQAIAEAAPGSLVEAYAQEGLGTTLFRLRERLDEAVTVSGEAAATANGLGVPQLEAETLATKAVSEAALGLAEARETAEAALVLQAACADRPVLRQPVFSVTVVRFWHDDLEGAHEAYETIAGASRELGDESSLPYLYVMLGQIDCGLGRFEKALSEAQEGSAIAEQAGQTALVAYGLAVRAVAEALLGRVDEALVSGSRALELARETSGVPAWIFATWALGHLALARGDARDAVASLRPLVEHHRRERIEEPGALPFLPDAIEAHVECGHLDEAHQMLDSYESAARRLQRRRGIAAARRLRGLLAAASGDVESALTELNAAVELYSTDDTPFERARSLLALGVVQRRTKRRKEARGTLDEALAVFERVGAALWADRARAELRRISGRAATPGALTPAEERVATLVAEGKTNREVAAALFLSDRTVEGHLSHVFGKLGIRHRAEVGPALASRQTQGIEKSNTGDSPVSADRVAP